LLPGLYFAALVVVNISFGYRQHQLRVGLSAQVYIMLARGGGYLVVKVNNSFDTLTCLSVS
jgi:hypothetical protein